MYVVKSIPDPNCSKNFLLIIVKLTKIYGNRQPQSLPTSKATLTARTGLANRADLVALMHPNFTAPKTGTSFCLHDLQIN